MREVQASDMEERFPELLSEVEQGEMVVIMREGKPIARLVPEAANAESNIKKADVFEQLRALRQQLPRTGITIDDILTWRHEGHGR